MQLEPRMRLAINTMAVSIHRILADAQPSIYLYGSVTAEDYRQGWSDIDLLVLTREAITQAQADALVALRQLLAARDPDTPYYRLFEGGMLDLGSFLTGEETRVVYWGTTGQRIKTTHDFSAFDRASLLQNGQLLLGRDVRRHLDMPDYTEITAAAAAHLAAIREHGKGSRSIYAYGWLLDIARCLYTMVNGRLTTKTDAAQWALDEHLCPCPSELAMALTVRRQPELIRDESVLDYAEALTPAIQAFTALLEKAVGMNPS
ncbi:MAG: nucleotidyltransferase domain-containing protein [Clostridia bacterium]|nr:nucleotidyltransferase domain-containing protein [Clostridia bacterium]